MSLKYVVSLLAPTLIGSAVSPSHGAELVSCNGFESCPTNDGDAIVALEARIAALEALLPEIPSSGIILWDSTTSCPTGYTAVTTAYLGGASLDNYYLRATTGSGAGTVSGSSPVSPAISATSTGTAGSTDLAHTHLVSGFSTIAQNIVAAYLFLAQATRYLKTEEAKEIEVAGTFTLILYGGGHINDLETLAILDKEEDQYEFEPYAPEFDYKVKKGVPAGEALNESRKFVGFHNTPSGVRN